MMMVPMMMSADGSGATSAVPMMNPYMGAQPAPVMPQAYCPMPQQHMAAPVAAAAPGAPPASAAAQAPAASTPAPHPVAQAPVAAATHHPMMAAPQQMGQPQVAPYPFMMQAPMGGGGYMMPVPTTEHHSQMQQHHPMMPGQPMTMVPHQAPMAPVPQVPQQDGQSNIQEQKDSSPGMNGGSNLAHCA